MEISVLNQIPLWGIMGALFTFVLFVWKLQTQLLLAEKRIDALEKTTDKILTKIEKIEDELKEILIKLK